MQPVQPRQSDRPAGVTILAILAIIGGVFGLCFGAFGAVGSAALSADPNQNTTHLNTGLTLVLSIVLLLTGIGDLIFGIGALQLKPWAWPLGVGLEATVIILNLVEFVTKTNNIFTLVIGAAIAGYVIFYLLQPQVQQAFGRVAAAR